jgi:hypothetical protein
MPGPELALPGGMVAVGFGAFPHPNASFYVGLVAGQVFYLTGQPDAFNDMTRASGLRVADEQTAELLARAFVETTRTMRTFSRVLDSADDIRWDTRPGREPAPEIVAQLRDYVRPPTVTAVGPGLYQVRLAVLNGAAVEHRVLTVTPAGDVTEQTEDAVEGLPVPMSV